MNKTLENRLSAFVNENKMLNKGALCVALVITRYAKNHAFPLNPSELLTESQGQVLGLGKSAVQNILNDYGINRVLAEEGGRTSRGSVGNMQTYVAFLNGLHENELADLEEIEKWWVNQVNAFFSAKPFILRFDPAKSLRFIIRDLLNQAQIRQEENQGATFAGTVLQHLVGAKLDLILLSGVEHHGASVADAVSSRSADFLVEDVAIHVTTVPGEAVIRKCSSNIEAGLKPIIITTQKGVALAEGLADQANIGDRLDVFEAEQFIAGNLYEIGKFASKGRKTTADQIIEKYNMIVSICETDPSLKINVCS